MAVSVPDPQVALATAPARGTGRLRRVVTFTGLAILAAAVLAALAAPLLAPHDPSAQTFEQLQSPSGAHLLGTDALGRDVLSRLLYALRTDLMLVVLAAGLPMAIGTLLGAVAAFVGGFADGSVRWIADVFQALPVYVLLIALVFVLGPGTSSLLIAFCVMSWVVYARLIRTEVRRVREREFVLASHLIGVSRVSVLFRHVLPNSINQTLVYLATDLGLALQAIATLSFFGLGVKSGTPELGAMVAEAQLQIRTHWWLAAIPGVVIVVIGCSIAAVGDHLGRRLEARR